MKHLKYVILALILISGVFLIEADDKELFMGLNLDTFVVKPNVVVLMDSSGSMNSAITYPRWGMDGIANTADDGFNAAHDYSGTVDNDPDTTTSTNWYARWLIPDTDGILYARERSSAQMEGWGTANFWTGCYADDGSGNNFQVGGYSVNFRAGEKIIFNDTSGTDNSAVATLVRRYQMNGNNWFELSDIEGGPIITDGGHFQQSPDGQNWQPVIVKLYGTSDMGNSTRYGDNYMRWLFIHTTDAIRTAVSHFSTYGTFDVNVTPPPEEPNDYNNPDWVSWWVSDCITDDEPDRIKHRFLRIQTAREVICSVAEMSNSMVNLGLFRFNSSNGATQMDSITPSADPSQDLKDYKDMVYGVEGNSWTPLAESLADIYKYYKPGDPNSKDYDPVDEDSDEHDVEHWCQNNYVIIMTDGESTQDNFNNSKFNNSMFQDGEVQRSEAYTTFAAWDPSHGWGDYDSNEASSGRPSGYNSITADYCPNWTCWLGGNSGTDYLDDVAYFMRHQDLFPDDIYGTDPVSGWPGDQNIYTYTIGFNIDNDLLRETAVNGDGAYYTANSYQDLVNAFQRVITGILLRNFAFSAITAPKKSATTTNDDMSVSYIGYFMPSQADSIWEGHLLAFELVDKWGFDADGNNGITMDEYAYDTEVACRTANSGEDCARYLSLDRGHRWDAAEKMPEDRNLFTHDDTTNIAFTLANKAAIKAKIYEEKWGYDVNGIDDITADEFIYDTKAECEVASGGITCESGLDTLYETEIESIIDTLNEPNLADIFHSDVGYIGAPIKGKKYAVNINPLDQNGETYEEFYEANKERRRRLFFGTNDGIFHMMNADDELYDDEREAGIEKWGFIPDEVLPKLHTIVNEHEHTYTVDGQLSADDIYYTKESQSAPSWSTVLSFGLRSGGNAFYTLDITEYGSEPKLLWKFKDDTYSGESWGKATYGKILMIDPGNAGPLDNPNLVDKWVAVIPGGFAFNEENDNDLKGKAVFIVDAATGELLWMVGYNPTLGAEADSDSTEIDVTGTDDYRYLSKDPLLNYPVPKALSVLDLDNNGYIDSIYFGNVGGNLFAINISNIDRSKWQTYNLYQNEVTTTYSGTIDALDESGSTLTMTSTPSFAVGSRIRGLTSNAQGYITAIEGSVLTIHCDTENYFEDNEEIVTRSYDPIFLSPTLAFDTCYQLWVVFGTGDRDRPRSNPESGNLIALRHNYSFDNQKSNLHELLWSNGSITNPEIDPDLNGWYFQFPDDTEKLFSPKPVILPDSAMVPHLYLNTYQQPSSSLDPSQIDNPCAIPSEGIMTLYDIAILSCGESQEIEVTTTAGRIAGGGIYTAKEYVLFTSESSDVGSVPGEGTDFKVQNFSMGSPGKIVFWKEKKR
ncbi:MAG: hypothetical protein GY765_36040 [bacterium]|nr:hypothetical protein [bacterium]